MLGLLFLCFCFVSLFLFLLCQADWGEGDLGDTPTMTARAGPGVGNGYTGGKGCLPREGQRLAAAIALVRCM